MSKGRKSLYLDFYPPIIHPVTGKQTRREFLKLYVYEKPKWEADKVHNKDTMILAQNIRAQRQIHIQADNYKFFLPTHRKMDFLEYFKNMAERRKNSSGNYDSMMSAYKQFEKFVGSKCLMEDLTEMLVRDFKQALLATADLEQNSKHSYFNKFRFAVKSAFEDKYLDDDPCRRIKAIPAQQTNKHFLSLEELKKLSKTECECETLKRMALFSALTGLRWSDVVKVNMNDIFYSKKTGYYLNCVDEKTGRPQVKYMSKEAYLLLKDEGSTDVVFKRMVYSANNNSKLKLWVAKAGIKKKITFHNFRHTYATLQLAAGTDIYTVSDGLNHKSLKNTQIYAKVVDDKKIKAATAIRLDINFS